jgi:hypothetical protein
MQTTNDTTTNATHTPGPWRVSDHRVTAALFPESRASFLSVEAAGFVAGGGIALVHLKIDTDVSVANARLIAAAPDILQALREVEGDCYYIPDPGVRPRCGFCQQDEGEPHEPECTMNFVLAALAKAEGRAL